MALPVVSYAARPPSTGDALELPFSLACVPAGFPSPAEDYLENSLDIDFGTLIWLSRNLDDEEWILIFDAVKGVDLIGMNPAHPTSFHSRIIESAGEPEYWALNRNRFWLCQLTNKQ
jgi:hypothetical protein